MISKASRFALGEAGKDADVKVDYSTLQDNLKNAKQQFKKITKAKTKMQSDAKALAAKNYATHVKETKERELIMFNDTGAPLSKTKQMRLEKQIELIRESQSKGNLLNERMTRAQSQQHQPGGNKPVKDILTQVNCLPEDASDNPSDIELSKKEQDKLKLAETHKQILFSQKRFPRDMPGYVFSQLTNDYKMRRYMIERLNQESMKRGIGPLNDSDLDVAL